MSWSSISETLESLFSLERLGVKMGLEHTEKLLSTLGNPQRNLNLIHIAGTNGKGSTSSHIECVLRGLGKKVGLYTSPHLVRFNERIRVNGIPITNQEIESFLKKSWTNINEIKSTFFETTTAMALSHFNLKKVDIAIIETGLGGRLDSTNIIRPLVSVITNIGFDHTSLLGNTLGGIANEKAGIIKKDTPVIIGRKQKECENIFITKAKKNNSSISFCLGETKHQTDLKGNYQSENVRTTLFSIKEIQKQGFTISEENIKNGLMSVMKNTSLLGRWQILQKEPLIICDSAHNEDGIKEVVKQLRKVDCKELHFVLGTVNDKNIDNILGLLPKKARYYFCQANIPRSLEKESLQTESKKHGLSGELYNSVSQALQTAKKNARKEDCIFVGGSTFVVAEII